MTSGYAVEPSAPPSAFGSRKSLTPFSGMRSANLTALSGAVAFWLPAVLLLLAGRYVRKPAHQGEQGKDDQWPERSLMVPLLLR
jgi:hypothetical protein